MAEPETDISLRAAQVAADISEEDRPQERHRLVCERALKAFDAWWAAAMPRIQR